MADWTAIKTEYIADPKSSYRSLADKYGVSKDMIYKRAKAESWQKARRQADDKTTTKIVSKVVAEKVRKVSGVQTAAEGLAEQILQYVQSGELLDPDSIAKLTRSLKDLKDIKHDLTEYELREQDMRLRALEKQINAGADEDNDALGVVFLPGAAGKLLRRRIKWKRKRFGRRRNGRSHLWNVSRTRPSTAERPAAARATV